MTWLECGQHSGCEDETITLITGYNHNVEDVIDLPESLRACQPSQLAMCEKINRPDGCPNGYDCIKAHSPEELEYWKWTLICRVFEQVHTLNIANNA